jgi:hypothetical protein
MRTWLPLVVSIAVTSTPMWAQLRANTDEAEDRAVAAIVRAEGRVQSSTNTPGNPVERFDLLNAHDGLMEHLGTLTHVKTVWPEPFTGVILNGCSPRGFD